MTGVKIPVIEIEKLTLKEDGRGLYGLNDGVVCSAATWTGTSGSADLAGKVFLPAASTAAWLKVTVGSTAYYFPGFNTYW